MPNILLFNKPFQVLCQFSADGDKQTLAHYIDKPNYYPAGRLDYDSEGLLLLTDDGKLQQLISDPKWKLPKTYWVQVEGHVSELDLLQLASGVELNDGKTLPCSAKQIDPPNLSERNPPIRQRAHIPTSWIELTLQEGRNRQVRRMTAHIGYPTLRLFRAAIGPWQINSLNPGESRLETLTMEKVLALWPNYAINKQNARRPSPTKNNTRHNYKSDPRPRKSFS